MTRKRIKVEAILALTGVILLSGCASMKVPNLDFIQLPEFREEAENIGGYPKVEDAPETPKPVKTDKEWDQAAKRVMAERDALEPVQDFDAPKSDAQIEAEIDALAAKVEEYKLDDPE